MSLTAITSLMQLKNKSIYILFFPIMSESMGAVRIDCGLPVFKRAETPEKASCWPVWFCSCGKLSRPNHATGDFTAILSTTAISDSTACPITRSRMLLMIILN